MRLNYYVSEIDTDIQMQFSAVTFFPDDGSVYIAYRGTDGTLVGWREDCNMAFTFPLPAQEAGLLYMNSVSGFIPSDTVVRTGGHSKGGNIAMYAAMKCNPSLRNRIADIYNHDGPGFISEVLITDEYASIRDRVRKTLPHSSFFGMLLHQGENYSVVESSGISGFLQHIPFNWVVEGGDFRYIDKVKNSSFQTQIAINEWLRSHTPEEQKHLIDTIFGLLETTKVENFNDMNEDWLKTSLKILSAAKDMDPETKSFYKARSHPSLKFLSRPFPRSMENSRHLLCPRNPLILRQFNENLMKSLFFACYNSDTCRIERIHDEEQGLSRIDPFYSSAPLRLRFLGVFTAAHRSGHS